MNDIEQWLANLGLSQYADTFAENGIDVDVLSELTEEDLKELGVLLGHRRKILKHAADLLEKPPESPSVSSASSGSLQLTGQAPGLAKLTEGERKQVTVLFADIAGSTELIRDLDPEVASQMMEPVLDVMAQSVHRYQGTVARLEGDGVMALFGVPLAAEDHAVRACFTALDMQRAMKEVTDRVLTEHGALLKIRVGLNSGEVVVKSLSSDLRMDYEAIGMVVHLAARMESVAAPGSIQLTSETRALAEGFIEVVSRGAIPVKGVSEPVEIFDLTGVGPASTRLQASLRLGRTRFVGRDFEFKALEQAMDEARTGRGQVVALAGEAGVGKSRLLYEFTRSSKAEGCLLLEATAASYTQTLVLSLIAAALRPYFAIESGDPPERIINRITKSLLELEKSLAVTLPAFLSLFGLPSEEREWGSLELQARKNRTLNAIQDVVLTESRRQPVILLLEDLHWADVDTIVLLDRLVERVATSQVLILVSYRPEFGHTWNKLFSYTQLRIETLSYNASTDLVNTLLGTDQNLAHLRDTLIGRAGGNPLFIEQAVRELNDAGFLEGELGAYSAITPVSEISIPATVQAIISARIDRLSASAKELLQCASVIGHRVPLRLLPAVSEKAESTLREELSELLAKDFLYEVELYPEENLSFKHPLTQEVSYSSLLKNVRRDLHHRAGIVLQELAAERPEDHVEAIAHHFAEGENWKQAAKYKLRAVEKALRQFSIDNAITLGTEALARTIHECGSSGAHGTDFACFVCSTGRRVGDQTVVAGLD